MDHISKLDPPRPWLLDRHIPRDLETIVLKAMDKDPQRRYRSASEMHEDLQRFLEVAPDFVHSLAFSHDSALLALQDRNGIVTVWEAATRKLKYAFRSHRATNIITHTRLAFSPKRHVLACISEDFRGLMLHDLERGVVRRLKGEVRGMQRLPSPRMVSLSPQQASGKNS
jgi:serine/threonine protein kinase